MIALRLRQTANGQRRCTRVRARTKLNIQMKFVVVNSVGACVRGYMFYQMLFNIEIGNRKKYSWIDEGAQCMLPRVNTYLWTLAQVCHARIILDSCQSNDYIILPSRRLQEIKIELEIEWCSSWARCAPYFKHIYYTRNAHCYLN